MWPREDVQCPACPDGDTAFRVRDVGMKLSTEGDYLTGGGVTFKATRPLWEPVMLEHLRLTDNGPHQQLYGQCVAALKAAGQTVEESAQGSVQAVVDSVRWQMDDMVRRRTL